MINREPYQIQEVKDPDKSGDSVWCLVGKESKNKEQIERLGRGTLQTGGAGANRNQTFQSVGSGVTIFTGVELGAGYSIL